MVWKCTVCAHLTVGLRPPENCPICGVPKEQFTVWERASENLGATATHQHLEQALSGEATAVIKYLTFAMVAELEGRGEAATLFRQRADEEVVHAISHLVRLGMVGSTPENLKAAADGESYESNEMYPAFSHRADEEDLSDAALYFSWLAQREGIHAVAYSELYNRLTRAED